MQNEQATSTVTVNGEQAKEELSVLEQRAKKLKEQLTAANQAGDGKVYNKLSRELKATQKEMRQLAKESFDVKKVLDNLSGASMSDLTKAQKQLSAELRKPHIKRNSEEWKQLAADLRRVKQEQALVNKELQVGENRFSKFTNGFNKYFGAVTAGIAALTGISFAFKSAAKEAAKMSDVYAGVMKYTGESAEGVAELNTELRKMDTRTSREELNRLLGEAGKLGIEGRDNLLGFARAADVIQVALGDDLGEDAVKSIGKLAEMFGVTDQMGIEKAMLSVGSAINEVAQNSTASEPYLLQFTNRLAGIGKTAGLTIPQIMGFGAVLDQNAQQVEMSGTALNKFISTLATKSDQVAKAVGLPAEELNRVVREDMNEALMMVFRELNKKGGLIDLAPLFKDLGAEGARAGSVITILADKFADLEREQALANKAFSEGTSVVKEFDVQNNTMQARLDKAKKRFLDASEALGGALSPALLKSTNLMTYVIKLAPSLLKFMETYGKYILYAATVGAAYVAATKLNVLWTTKFNAASILSVATLKLKAAWMSTARVATLAYNVVLGLFTMNITHANAALKLLNQTIKANPIGFLASVIVAAIPVITSFVSWLFKGNKEIEELKEKTKAIAEETRKYSGAIAEEQSQFNALMRSIINTNKESSLRKSLIDDIKKAYPQYLEYLDLEKMSNQELETVLSSVNKLYEKRYDLAAIKGKSDVEEKAIVTAKQRQMDIKNEISALESQEKQTDKTRKKITQLTAEYDTLTESIQSSITKVSEYGKQAASVQADLSKHDSADGLMELMNKKGLEIQRQQEWYEAIMQSGVSAETKKKAKADLDALYSELDFLSAKWMAMIEADAKKKGNEKDPGGSGGSGDEDPVTIQRKRINARLQKLELENAEEVNKIKEQYRDGDIENEEKYNEKLLQQQTIYLEKQKDALEDFQKSISDEGLQMEISSKIFGVDAALLNQEIDKIKKTEKEAADEQKKDIEARDKLLKDYKLQNTEDLKAAELELVDLYEKKKLLTEEQAAQLRVAINKKYTEESKGVLDRFFEWWEERGSKAAQSIGNTFGDLEGMVSNFQAAAEKRVETRYQKQIDAAKKAGKDTTKIEEQKEEEIRRIRAESADKQFLMTIAAVIAQTAQAAISSFAQASQWGGPIAGGIAAAAATAYGASQIAIAKAQHEAAKEGYAEGGFTPSGGKYEPRGIVHAGEFVANQDAVRNAPLRRVFDLVNHAQRTNTVARINAEDIAEVLNIRRGFSAGGYSVPTPAPTTGGITKEELSSAIGVAMAENTKVNAELLRQIQNGIRADVSVSGRNGIDENVKKFNRLKNNARGV